MLSGQYLECYAQLDQLLQLYLAGNIQIKCLLNQVGVLYQRAFQGNDAGRYDGVLQQLSIFFVVLTGFLSELHLSKKSDQQGFANNRANCIEQTDADINDQQKAQQKVNTQIEVKANPPLEAHIPNTKQGLIRRNSCPCFSTSMDNINFSIKHEVASNKDSVEEDTPVEVTQLNSVALDNISESQTNRTPQQTQLSFSNIQPEHQHHFRRSSVCSNITRPADESTDFSRMTQQSSHRPNFYQRHKGKITIGLIALLVIGYATSVVLTKGATLVALPAVTKFILVKLGVGVGGYAVSGLVSGVTIAGGSSLFTGAGFGAYHFWKKARSCVSSRRNEPDSLDSSIANSIDSTNYLKQ